MRPLTRGNTSIVNDLNSIDGFIKNKPIDVMTHPEELPKPLLNRAERRRIDHDVESNLKKFKKELWKTK